jgi:hypothetical protein
MMEQEYDSGVAYLKALKQPATSAAGAAGTETHTEAHPGSDLTAAPSGNRFHGTEKRRSLRYQCEGSIEMREDSTDAHTWATFTDISLHGCYVEAQSAYPKGTALRIKLEAHGVRAETQGIVRVSARELSPPRHGDRLRGNISGEHGPITGNADESFAAIHAHGPGYRLNAPLRQTAGRDAHHLQPRSRDAGAHRVL